MHNLFKSVCFSGHRLEKLPSDLDILKEKVKEEIINSIEEGYDTFYQGACYGFDLICAKIVIDLKEIYPNVSCISVVPYKLQAKSWAEETKMEYNDILEKSDEVIVLSEKYYSGCFHARNRYMVDNSSKIIAYCNEKTGGTKYTLNYALQRGLNCINLA